MTLDHTIIAGSPVTTKADTKTVAGTITSTAPPGLRVLVVDGGLVSISQFPEREGQMLFYRNGTDLFVTMYVVVDVNNGNTSPQLEWRQVQNWGLVQDPRTGRAKDSNSGYYSSLAS